MKSGWYQKGILSLALVWASVLSSVVSVGFFCWGAKARMSGSKSESFFVTSWQAETLIGRYGAPTKIPPALVIVVACLGLICWGTKILWRFYRT
jgi:hypothetical protein